MRRRRGGGADPSWYKRAIIYELPVKSFMDANNDGIGDFAGLVQKLDYLEVMLQWGRGCAAAESDSLASLELSRIWSTYRERRQSGAVASKDPLRASSRNPLISFVLKRASDSHILFSTLPLAHPGEPPSSLPAHPPIRPNTTSRDLQRLVPFAKSSGELDAFIRCEIAPVHALEDFHPERGVGNPGMLGLDIGHQQATRHVEHLAGHGAHLSIYVYVQSSAD